MKKKKKKMLRLCFPDNVSYAIVSNFPFPKVFRESGFLLFPLSELHSKMKTIFYKLLGFRIYLSFILDEKNYNCKCQYDTKNQFKWFYFL